MVDHPIPHPDLAGYVMGSLEPEEAEAFEEHLASCSSCLDEVGELSALPALLERAAPRVDPPIELRRRTLQAVDRAARTTTRRRWSVRVASIAAALIVLAGGLTAWTRHSPDHKDIKVSLVAVKGAPGNPAGSAELEKTDVGWYVDLDLHGMAQTKAGTYYECWYIGDEDRPGSPDRVSAGSFTVGANGRAKVRMSTGADLHQYKTMQLTLEPGDGNPAASGQPVLTTRA
jgi:anti-sigma-K factor RskA